MDRSNAIWGSVPVDLGPDPLGFGFGKTLERFRTGAQLAIPTEPAQLGLDGAPIAPQEPPPPAGTVDDPLPAPDPSCQEPLPHVEGIRTSQLAFQLGPVKMLRGHRHEAVARVLAQLCDTTRAKTTFQKRAKRMLDCGSMLQVMRCSSCGTLDRVTVSADCGSRACAACARKAAQENVSKIRQTMKRMPGKRSKAFFLHTATLKTPAGVSIERLRVDRELCLKLFGKTVWPFLKSKGATHGFVRIEVGAETGMVHFHAIVRHRYLRLPELMELRRLVREASGGRTRQYNVKRGRKNVEKEVSKYLTKMSTKDGAMEGAHPLLVAMIDVAWYNQNCSRFYVADGCDWNEGEPEEKRTCSSCGGYLASMYFRPEQLPDDARSLLMLRAAARAPPATGPP